MKQTLLGLALALFVVTVPIVAAATYTTIEDDGIISVENANIVEAEGDIVVVRDTSADETARINNSTGVTIWSRSDEFQNGIEIGDGTIFAGNEIVDYNGTVIATTPIGSSDQTYDIEYDPDEGVYYVAGGADSDYAIYEANGTAKWQVSTSTGTQMYANAIGNGSLWYARNSDADSSADTIVRHYKENGTFAANYSIPVGQQVGDNDIKYAGGYLYVKIANATGYYVRQYSLSTDGSETIYSNRSVADTREFGDQIAVNETYVYVQRSDSAAISAYYHDNLTFAKNFSATGWGIEHKNSNVNGGDGPAETMDRNLEIEINKWMPKNSTQDYTVILNETNTTTGETTLTDVTAAADVTSGNVSIVAVNNSTDQLEAQGITARTFVNASYDGHTSNDTNVTVGPRNLDNIGIMPPEQWPCSFLVCDENPQGGDNPHNIGSSMQWTLFIIVAMAAASRMFENPWSGVGAGMLTSILLWVLEFVVLGVVLGTVFAGILVGIIMVRSSMGRGVGRDDEFSGTAGGRFRR